MELLQDVPIQRPNMFDSLYPEVDFLLPRDEVEVRWILENMKIAAADNRLQFSDENLSELCSLVTKVLDPEGTGSVTKQKIKELSIHSELLAHLLAKLRAPNKKGGARYSRNLPKSLTTIWQSWGTTPGDWNPTENAIREEEERQQQEEEEEERQQEDSDEQQDVHSEPGMYHFSKSGRYNVATKILLQSDDESEEEDYQMWATDLTVSFLSLLV